MENLDIDIWLWQTISDIFCHISVTHLSFSLSLPLSSSHTHTPEVILHLVVVVVAGLAESVRFVAMR